VESEVLQNPSFWRWASYDDSRTALVTSSNQITFGALNRRSNQLARALRQLGLRSGDRISLFYRNEPAFFETYFAVAQIGVVAVVINYHLTADEAIYMVRDSNSTFVLASETCGTIASRAARELQFPPERLLAYGSVDGFKDVEGVLANQSGQQPDQRIAGQIILYTSGTLGRPKGVLRQQASVDPDVIAREEIARARPFGLTPGLGCHLVAGPLHHGAPHHWAIRALHLGHTTVVMPKFDALTWLTLVEKYQVTSSFMVPTMFVRLLRIPTEVRNGKSTSSLRTVIHAGAPCPIEIKRQMMEWLGPILYEYYAAMEAGGTMVGPHEWVSYPGTVGKARPGINIRILDEQLRDCPTGTIGRVYLGGSPAFRYLNDDDKTASAYHDGYVTVGDIGYLDPEGHLYLCDREADIIISGGVNIYPAEIEAALTTHPLVQDAAVVGVQDDEWGERVKAFVVPTAHDAAPRVLIDSITQYCRERLAGYKVPRDIEIVANIPRTDAGKLRRRELRDRAAMAGGTSPNVDALKKSPKA
jgi:long-chain acyl-CoA synthetase